MANDMVRLCHDEAMRLCDIADGLRKAGEARAASRFYRAAAILELHAYNKARQQPAIAILGRSTVQMLLDGGEPHTALWMAENVLAQAGCPADIRAELEEICRKVAADG